MLKIAIINQRYGLEVNGGSEYYTRMIAEQLNKKYDVEVLTTCAIDYASWKNYYKEGEEELNGVKVRRFPAERERKQKEFSEVTLRIFQANQRTEELEREWVEKQGPYAPKLVEYIEREKDNIDVFIFVTYLYYFTAVAMPKVAEKSILIPTAHDEPYLEFETYKRVFKCPKAYIFLTEEEQELVYRKFGTKDKFTRQTAVGIEVPEAVDKNRFLEKYKITDPYMIYVGRIDEGKNCHWMFKYFLEYKKRHPKSDLKLVLMGKAVIPVPDNKDIINLGFVSEEDKYDGVAGCEFLVLPSEFESLSLSVLEAMELGRPVLVNGNCEVLKGHCKKSNAGFYYRNYFEFEGEVDYLMTHKQEYDIMCYNAKKYVEQNYKWDVVLRKFDETIQYVAGKNE